MNIELECKKGSGVIVSYDRAKKILGCNNRFSLAPGERIELEIKTEPPFSVQAKSLGSKKNESGFTTRIKLISLRKHDEAHILNAFSEQG